jgi:hypothetical protein
MVEVGAGVRRLPLGALLIKAGVASEADIQDALDEGNRKGERLGQVVLRRGWVSERRLAKLLGDQWGLKAPDPAKLKTDPAALARIDAGLAAELGGLPVGFDEDGLVVAVSEPRADRFEAFQALLGSVSFVVVPPSTLGELLDVRRAMFGRTPTPVELVGAWLRTTDESSEVVEEAVVRDIPDEAPLDDVNFEEEPMAAMEELQEETPPAAYEPTFPSFPETGSVVEHLQALMAAVETLEREAAETRRRSEAQETEIEELRRTHASDLETISSLGAELEERRRRLDSLRAVVGELTVELEK